MNDDSLQYLTQLGWDPFFQRHFQILKLPGSVPARVMSESKGSYQVYSQYGELTAKISGTMRYQTGTEVRHPAVGDWVIVKPLVDEQKGTIHVVLPRKSKFSRKVAGERTEEQVVSANVDTVFIVSGLDGGRNFNLRRIERYLTLAWSSGAIPVVVLNKVDVCPNTDDCIRDLESIALGVSVHLVSAKERSGLDELRRYLTAGKTAAFLGPSGVGKSSLINALLGIDRQAIGEVREGDLMGKHTTTMRELIPLPGGGIVIDTPGMREIQMWGDENDVDNAFADIEGLSKMCHFTNCNHNGESGCAVTAAINRGKLDPTRLASYRKLQNELVYLASKEEQSTRVYEKAKFRKIALWSKQIQDSNR